MSTLTTIFFFFKLKKKWETLNRSSNEVMAVSGSRLGLGPN